MNLQPRLRVLPCSAAQLGQGFGSGLFSFDLHAADNCPRPEGYQQKSTNAVNARFDADDTRQRSAAGERASSVPHCSRSPVPLST